MINNLNNNNKNTDKNKNKVAVITGGARRIGAAITKYFHANNYNIIIHYNNSLKEADCLCNQLNDIRANSAKIIKADLITMSDSVIAKDFVAQIVNFYGYIDTLINNASSFFATPIGTVHLEDWRDLMASNVGGAFFLTQHLAPFLKITKGSIVNISDIHAVLPLKNYSVYSIAKAANDMMTKILARELAPDIIVNAVAPGSIIWPEDTGNKKNGNKKNALKHEIQQQIINRILLKRQGTPDDIASAVFFLAESKYITGQILAVDGGRSIKD